MEGRRAPRPCALTILHPSGPSGGPSTDWESLAPRPVPEAPLEWADTHMHIHVGGQTDTVTRTQMRPHTHTETWTRAHTPPADTHRDVDTRSHTAHRHTRRRGHALTRRLLFGGLPAQELKPSLASHLLSFQVSKLTTAVS